VVLVALVATLTDQTAVVGVVPVPQDQIHQAPAAARVVWEEASLAVVAVAALLTGQVVAVVTVTVLLQMAGLLVCREPMAVAVAVLVMSISLEMRVVLAVLVMYILLGVNYG